MNSGKVIHQSITQSIKKGNVSTIEEFSYSCFKFKFKKVSPAQAQQLLIYINHNMCSNGKILPWEMGNYLLANNIKFSISFVYCKLIPFSGNFLLFKEVLRLKMELINIKIRRTYYKILSAIKNLLF